MEETLAHFEARLERMEKVRMNTTKSRPWKLVEKTAKFVPVSGYEEPSYLSKDAGKLNEGYRQDLIIKHTINIAYSGAV